MQPLYVNFETALLREGLETGDAAERLFARMDFHVTIELGLFGKRLHALRAAERSLSRMNAFVSGEMAFFGEALFADGALERPRAGATQFQTIALERLRAAFGTVGLVMILVDGRVDVLILVLVQDPKIDHLQFRLRFGVVRVCLRRG